AMRDDVYAGARGDLGPLERDGVGEDFEAVLVRLVDQSRQRLLVHTGHVGRGAVAPAVGEGLDHVGLIGQRAAHGGAGLSRGRDFEREEFAAPAFRAVPARRGYPHGQADARRGDNAGPDQSPHRLEHLAVRAEIHHRGHAAVKIRLQVLRPVVGGAADGRVGQVRVQVKQAGHERQPFGVDDAGAGGQFDFRRDGIDAVAAYYDGLPRWLRAGPVNHGRANYGDYIFVVLSVGV